MENKTEAIEKSAKSIKHGKSKLNKEMLDND